MFITAESVWSASFPKPYKQQEKFGSNANCMVDMRLWKQKILKCEGV